MGIICLSIFSFGLVIGSFMNVVIYRLPRKLNIVWKRSFCPKCKKKINWFDNIPLLSFFLLGGRCRSCRSLISWRYPVVELTTGVLFLLSYLSNLGILSYLLFSGLIVIFFIDLEHQVIPDEIVFPLIILFSLRQFFPLLAFFSNFSLLTSRFSPFFSAIGSFFFMFAIYLATKGRGMGLGDVKFAFLMGLVLGFPKVVIAFYLAFLTGAFIGVILILVGKARFSQKIAFGPFLAFSTITTYLWGEVILEKLSYSLF